MGVTDYGYLNCGFEDEVTYHRAPSWQWLQSCGDESSLCQR